MSRKTKEIDAGRLAEAELIYSAYPRKAGGRPKAIQAILKALEKCQFEDLYVAVEEYRDGMRGEDKRFIPYPATWFNQERWTDDRDEWKPQIRVKPETVLEIARSQCATADEAWRIVWETAKRMEQAYTGHAGASLANSEANRQLAATVPEPARSVASSIRWTNIRFGDENQVRREFCVQYERRLRAEVNRRVAPALLGAVGLPGVEQKRIGG